MNMTMLFRKASFHFLKLLSLSISAILGIFCTFGGCMYGPGPAPMYGMPNADYKISGTVSSADQNLPIRGLLVSIADTLDPLRIIDSTKTDSVGKYSLQFSGAPWENTWHLKAKDIDSVANGSFAAKDTTISIPESDLKEPSGNWYKGHGEKDVDLKVDRTNP
jgi:putative lipoprotein (rSAM/lipoprotein system)